MSGPAPDWSVICDLLPAVVHVRNDGHECKRPVVAHPDMTRAQLERLRKLAPRRSPAQGDDTMTTNSPDPVLSLELRAALAQAGPLSLETAEKVADEMIADGRAYALEQARQNNIPEEDALAMLADSRDAIVMMLMGTTTLDETMEATKRIGAHHGTEAAKRRRGT